MVSQSMKQRTFAELEQAHKKKVTRREKFLSEMDAVIPWARLEALIAPHYPKPKAGKPGRRPLSLATKLRIYCLQHFYGLSAPGAEEALYDSDAMRRFAGITLTDEAVPDETTILQFRRLLERHGLIEQVFAEVNAHLREGDLRLCEGTLVDATLIHAPSLTKNQSGTRDPDMSQTRKGNQWYFGCKAHIGADACSGLVDTVIGTIVKVADITQIEALLHGEECIVLGDAGYRRTGRSLDAPAPENGPRIVTPYVRSAGKTLLKMVARRRPTTGLAERPGRAYVSLRKMPVWEHQGPLSRPAQEHRAPEQPVCHGQPQGGSKAAAGGRKGASNEQGIGLLQRLKPPKQPSLYAVCGLECPCSHSSRFDQTFLQSRLGSMPFSALKGGGRAC